MIGSVLIWRDIDASVIQSKLIVICSLLMSLIMMGPRKLTISLLIIGLD